MEVAILQQRPVALPGEARRHGGTEGALDLGDPALPGDGRTGFDSNSLAAAHAHVARDREAAGLEAAGIDGREGQALVDVGGDVVVAQDDAEQLGRGRHGWRLSGGP